jgi:hypothetical protein
LDLLDPGKLQFLQKKTATLNVEILNLQANYLEAKTISHDKDEVILIISLKNTYI